MSFLPKYPELGKGYTMQSFGHVLMISLDKMIVGISENMSVLAGEGNMQTYLNTPFQHLAQGSFRDYAEKIMLTVDEIIHSKSPRKLMLHPVEDKVYYLCIYLYNSHVYLEWEEQKRKSISASEINEVGFLFDKTSQDIWNSLSHSIQKLIGYDRVFVLKVSESGAGKIVAEYAKNGRKLYEDRQFSSAFMTSNIIDYYEGRSLRYCPDLFQQEQVFYTRDPEIDFDPCPFKPIPRLHELYLKSIGVVSFIVFPLTVEDTFWGLVIGHNEQVRAIDLQKRKLCSFITQNAIGKFEGVMKQNLLYYYEQIKDVELELKDKLLFGKTVNCALAQNMQVLCDMPKADGLVLYHGGDLFMYGLCPSEKQVQQIVAFIQAQPKRPVFKDNNFRLKNAYVVEGELPFAGLMALQIGHRDDHYMIWFREETISTVTQIAPTAAGERKMMDDVVVYETWEDTIHDSAIPWDDDDLSFVKRLDKLINEAIITKAKEYEKSNEELISLNNELEMLTFTLSHDLKNPLSIVKMGVQYLDAHENLSADKKRRWVKSILDGVDNIEGIVNNVLHINTAHSYKYAEDPIPMAYTLRTLCEDAKILYDNPKCSIKLGKLLPIWGEKGVLYQIFLNVVGNAVKYTSNRPFPTVEIDSSKHEDSILYTIKDNGIGIPEENLSSIFDVFIRASNSGAYSGSGIGLCLVKRIMDRVGGTIDVSSKVNEGTIVKLTFPLVDEFPEVIGGH